MILPSGNRGRLVALAILLILVILAVEFVIVPLVSAYRQVDEEIGDRRQEIRHLQHLLARAPALENAATKLKRNDPLDPITLNGSNAALAAAELQQVIQNAATKNGVRIVSLRVQPAVSTDQNMERVAVEVRVQTEIVGLRNLLFALESSTPYIFFDQVAIRARSAVRSRRQTGHIDARLEIYGMRKAGQPSATTGS